MPGFLIAAAHKSSGKTTVTLGLCGALSNRGCQVQPFKKGPDYIDPLWLSLAAKRACYNLDFHTQRRDEIDALYQGRGIGADLCIVEGNKGLYDGLEVDGSNSNAALAAQLGLPVLLVLDCQGMTRGIAPLVLGYLDFEPQVEIGGIILNKLGGERHESKLRAVLEHYCDVPVLGAIQRDPALGIEERHLGLVPSNEAEQARARIAVVSERIAAQVDLQAVLAIADRAADRSPSPRTAEEDRQACDLRIGIARDTAFAFYYQDDLDQFRRCGAQLVFFDTLNDRRLPEVDGLFIGGGFPETQMDALQANHELRAEIHRRIEDGLPVYAECGGLMYLSNAIRWKDRSASMVGIIPGTATMHQRPVGRGYSVLRETPAIRWPQPASAQAHGSIAAHEFHHSTLDGLSPHADFAFEVLRGTGIDGRHDGFVYRNLLASYTHQRHTLANPWVQRFTTFIRQCKTDQLNGPVSTSWSLP